MSRAGDLLQIIESGIDGVRPSVIFAGVLAKPSPELKEWLGARQRFLFSVGKAALASAAAILGQVTCSDHFLIAPAGSGESRGFNVRWGSHPIPDERSVEATRELQSWIQALPDDSHLLAVLSGGSSALLVSPLPGVSLEAKRKVNELLIRSGASIQEINTVRKHLSTVKGGQLGRQVARLQCIVLVISGVIGDDLATIGSGPFYPDPTTFLEARQVLDEYGLWAEAPAEVQGTIERGMAGEIPETPKQMVPLVPHVVVASNATACAAAAACAQQLGYAVQMHAEPVSGWIEDVAKRLQDAIMEASPRSALIWGGEITIRVHGSGTGGRNQHLALLMSEAIAGKQAFFAAAGTDGIDGNSPAAGAWTDGTTLQRALQQGLDWRKAADQFDSFPFFERLGQSIRTGPTGTNVMDLYIALT